MDVPQLEAFWWVAQSGGLGGAAKRLYLSLPSVTARIQSLEADLGQELFERRARGLRLTEGGRVLLPYAERVLTDMQVAKQAVTELRAPPSAVVTVGCALSTETYPLAEAVGKFKALHPQVEVTVRTGRSQQMQRLVMDGTVEFGLVQAPLDQHQEIGTTALYEEETVLVCHPSHPLAGKGRVVAGQLAGEVFVVAERYSPCRSAMDQFQALGGVVPRASLEVESVEAIRSMVRHNLGIALLPRACVQRECESGVLATIELDTALLVREVILVWRRDRGLSESARQFVDVLGREVRARLRDAGVVALPATRRRSRPGVRERPR